MNRELRPRRSIINTAAAFALVAILRPSAGIITHQNAGYESIASASEYTADLTDIPSQTSELIDYAGRRELGKIFGSLIDDLTLLNDGTFMAATSSFEDGEDPHVIIGKIEGEGESQTLRVDYDEKTPGAVQTSIGEKSMYAAYVQGSRLDFSFHLRKYSRQDFVIEEIDLEEFSRADKVGPVIVFGSKLAVIHKREQALCKTSEHVLFAQQFVGGTQDERGTSDTSIILRMTIVDPETGELEKVEVSQAYKNSGEDIYFGEADIAQIAQNGKDLLVIGRNGLWRVAKEEDGTWKSNYEKYEGIGRADGAGSLTFDDKTGDIVIALGTGGGDIGMSRLVYDEDTKTWKASVPETVLRRTGTASFATAQTRGISRRHSIGDDPVAVFAPLDDSWNGIVGNAEYSYMPSIRPSDISVESVFFPPSVWFGDEPFAPPGMFGILYEPILYKDGHFSRATDRKITRRWELMARPMQGRMILMETADFGNGELDVVSYPAPHMPSSQSEASWCAVYLPINHAGFGPVSQSTR